MARHGLKCKNCPQRKSDSKRSTYYLCLGRWCAMLISILGVRIAQQAKLITGVVHLSINCLGIVGGALCTFCAFCINPIRIWYCWVMDREIPVASLEGNVRIAQQAKFITGVVHMLINCLGFVGGCPLHLLRFLQQFHKELLLLGHGHGDPLGQP